MTLCAACQAENPDSSRFCTVCGAPLVETCPSCGAEVPPGGRFCPACGTRIARTAGRGGGEERKVVTVLFADLVGFTSGAERLDPEDVRATLGPYSNRLRVELERFGGTVEKFVGDAVMALFGAPVAREDDPERAVRAALAIRDAVSELNDAGPPVELRVRIAVNTGEALVALGARPEAGEGMAAGDVVNTASRLQEAAPVNGILVGEATYRATRHAIEYRDAEPVVARGKSAPIPVWEAVNARSGYGVDVAERVRAPLVGRDEELDLLRDALDRARRQRAPQLVTLVGVPGIGKSRLVWELFQIVEQDPDLIHWRQGRSLPYGAGVTFSALAEMTKAQIGMLESDGPEEAARKLAEGVRDVVAEEADARWIEGHLRPLVGLDVARERGDRRDEEFAAWRRFLEALAEQRPLVLVFEDLHWADDALLDFVEYLVEWASGVPLLVVGTGRPELLAGRPGWGGGLRNSTTVSLSPLTEEETARLLATLLEQAVLPTEVQAELLVRAGGNPLCAEEFVRMLVDRGLLRRAQGGWRLESHGDLPLPESVQGIIAARLDTLPAEEKAIVQDAAVVGKGFWVGVLAEIGGRERSEVEERLHALERKEFLRRERRSSVATESQYVFWHILVRDVAYSQIPRALRAEKHRLAADWIESISPERAEDRAEMLAHHYLAALEFARAAGQEITDVAERARLALREAGDRASALNAFAAALRYYAEALELAPDDDPNRHDLTLRYAKALVRAEGRGEEVLAEARDGLLSIGDRAGAAEAEVMIGDIIWIQGRRDPALERYQNAVALLEDEPPSPSKTYVLSRMTGFLMADGQVEEAIRVGRDALGMADELGLDDLRANVLTSVGVARTLSGDLGGLEDLEHGLAVAVQSGSPESARSYFNLATTYANLGDLSRAFELEEQGRRALRRLGDAGLAHWATGELIYEHYWRGRWEDARRSIDEELEAFEGDTGHFGWFDCMLVQGWIRLARGEIESAREAAGSLLEFSRAAKAPQALLPTLAFAARAAVAAGETAEAKEAVDELLERWQGTSLISGFWTADLAVAAAATGRAEALLETASSVRPPTRWLEAACAYARDGFLRAADLYAEIGSEPDEAYARLRAAGALVEEGRRNEADAQLADALAFHRRAGARAYVREAEELLPASA